MCFVSNPSNQRQPNSDDVEALSKHLTYCHFVLHNTTNNTSSTQKKNFVHNTLTKGMFFLVNMCFFIVRCVKSTRTNPSCTRIFF